MKSTIRSLFRFLRLPWSDQYLLAITFILLGLIRSGLWLLPFRVLHQLVNRVRLVHQQPSGQLNTLATKKIVWAINFATRHMPGGAKCLARALTVQIILSLYGCTSNLRIGVAKKSTGELEAHAWIEHQDEVLIGDLPNLSSFTQLPSLDSIKL